MGAPSSSKFPSCRVFKPAGKAEASTQEAWPAVGIGHLNNQPSSGSSGLKVAEGCLDGVGASGENHVVQVGEAELDRVAGRGSQSGMERQREQERPERVPLLDATAGLQLALAEAQG